MDKLMSYSHVGLQLTVKVCAILSLSVVGIEVCVAESVMSGAKHERPLNEHVVNVDRKPDRCGSFSEINGSACLPSHTWEAPARHEEPYEGTDIVVHIRERPCYTERDTKPSGIH